MTCRISSCPRRRSPCSAANSAHAHPSPSLVPSPRRAHAAALPPAHVASHVAARPCRVPHELIVHAAIKPHRSAPSLSFALLTSSSSSGRKSERARASSAPSRPRPPRCARRSEHSGELRPLPYASRHVPHHHHQNPSSNLKICPPESPPLASSLPPVTNHRPRRPFSTGGYLFDSP